MNKAFICTIILRTSQKSALVFVLQTLHLTLVHVLAYSYIIHGQNCFVTLKNSNAVIVLKIIPPSLAKQNNVII